MKHYVNKTVAAAMLIAATLFFPQSLKAQTFCTKTNVLKVNTGIDANDNPIPFSASSPQDPFWTISAQTGGVPSGIVLGSPAYITFNSALGSSAFSSLISYSPTGGSNGYWTTGNTTYGYYSLTFSRTFTTCVDDDLTFDLDMAYDNYRVSVAIDGTIIPGYADPLMSDPSYYTWGNGFTTSMFLSAGTHTIDVRIGNEHAPFNENPTALNIVGKITGTTNSLVANNASADCVCGDVTASCDDLCYWKVTGNNILNGNNLFGTLTQDDVQITTNNSLRGIFTQNGDFGWNTMSPTAKLHVDVTSLTPTTGIRFQGLVNGKTDQSVLTVDASGNVHTRPYGAGGGSNACATVDMLPKTATTAGAMTCSQIYDDGTSVGINTTGGFGYTAGTGLFIAGAPGTQNVLLDVNGLTRSISFVATSDAKFKTNVTPLTDALDKVSRLRGVSYNWKREQYPSKGFDGNRHIGFLAQELLDAVPEAVIKDENGDYAVEYNAIIPVLAQAIREQQKQIEELRSLIQKQGGTASAAGPAASNGGYLAQNVPNPFSVSTSIDYVLPEGAHKAVIGIYDMNGREIRLFHLSQGAAGSVTIEGGYLKPGMYLYSLIIDGKYFDSKKMVLTSQ